MKTLQEVKTTAMKFVVRVADVVELARKFEQSPKVAMREVVSHMRDGFRDALENVMKAEIELFLGRLKTQRTSATATRRARSA